MRTVRLGAILRLEGLMDADEVVREFSTDLAKDAVAAVSPGEVDLFDEVADEYWTDPEAAVAAERRDEQLGFGIDLALLAPFAISIAVAVGQYLFGILTDALAGEAKTVVAAKLRALLRRKGEPDVPPLTPAQFAQVRTVALDAAGRLGLASDTARVLSDAIVGGLVQPPAAPSGGTADGRAPA
jgi:hypothetical protein